jgi:hypothetical protein
MASDNVIHNESCHPEEHKRTGIKYLTHGLDSTHILVCGRKKHTMKQILYNNQ